MMLKENKRNHPNIVSASVDGKIGKCRKLVTARKSHEIRGQGLGGSGPLKPAFGVSGGMFISSQLCHFRPEPITANAVICGVESLP